ncbi:MAG TPA: agmatine deiminase family protein [Puia sp.]|nr:agmatine deiminase family protein [Puia sp.]
MNNNPTPKQLGYYFPPEFAPHDATWLSWPHKRDSWPGKLRAVYPGYCQFVKELALNEKVCINVNNERMKSAALKLISAAGADLKNIEFFLHPTNDAWCRDHGPAFLINPAAKEKKIIVDWNYNAWGNKYPPFALDDIIPTLIAKHYNIPVYHPGIIMEGGSVDFNGKGTLVTSSDCLLNRNRNPYLNREQIETYLREYYGVEQILWVTEGIAGDDTDGHIDDTVRFVNGDTVIATIEENKEDENYLPLQRNLTDLKKMRLLNGRQLDIVELPMPDKIIYKEQRLPASYANFYIANKTVIVPLFRSSKDEKALRILEGCFEGRKIVGIDSTDIIWGLGSFHCLSQQEPAVTE